MSRQTVHDIFYGSSSWSPAKTKSKFANFHQYTSDDNSADTVPNSPPTNRIKIYEPSPKRHLARHPARQPPQNESKSANLHLYTHQTTFLTTPCPMSKYDFGKEGVSLLPRWEKTDLALALANMRMKLDASLLHMLPTSMPQTTKGFCPLQQGYNKFFPYFFFLRASNPYPRT